MSNASFHEPFCFVLFVFVLFCFVFVLCFVRDTDDRQSEMGREESVLFVCRFGSSRPTPVRLRLAVESLFLLELAVHPPHRSVGAGA